MRRPATNRSVHPKKPSESMALSGNRGHASFAALTMARPLFGMTPARSRTRKTSAISASVAGIAVTRTHSGAKRTGRNDGNAGHANAARTTCGAIISVGNLAVGPRFVDSPVRIAGEGRVDVGRVPGAGIAVTRIQGLADFTLWDQGHGWECRSREPSRDSLPRDPVAVSASRQHPAYTVAEVGDRRESRSRETRSTTECVVPATA